MFLRTGWSTISRRKKLADISVRRRYKATSSPKHNANLFSEEPGRKREPWELIYYLFMGGAAIVTTVGLTFKPNTSIKAWARDEAEVRDKLIQEGEELKLGVNYSQNLYGNKWTKEEIGVKPTKGQQA